MTRSHGSTGRDDLTGEHRSGDVGQLICAVVFAAVWVVDTFGLEWTTFLNKVVPVALRTTLGLVLLATSGVLALVSIRTVFGERRDPPVVIRTGLYGVIRHPMYLSEVLLYAGFLFLSMSLAAAVVWVGIVAFLRHLCRHEEGLLLDRFGDEYRSYMRDVPMWVPRLRRPRRDGHR